MAGDGTTITAAALAGLTGVRHAFFTRQGGVSEGPFASLNCGFGTGDDTDKVAANRARATAALGLADGPLVTGYQTHSADVAVVDDLWEPAHAPRVDGLVTRRPGVALGVLSADCAPVLFADAQAGVIGAAHAGWRGARAGILDATLEAMVDLGATAAKITVALGPCIQRESYEVGPEFHAAFTGDEPDDECYFVAAERNGHFLFDLPGWLAGRLARLSIGVVEPLPFDTRADAERFFSYRRATLAGDERYGSGLSAITLVAS